jgi:hypothetical protein
MRLRTTSGTLAVSAMLLAFPSPGQAATTSAEPDGARTGSAGTAALGAWPPSLGAAQVSSLPQRHRPPRHEKAAITLGRLRLTRHSPLSPRDQALMRIRASIDLDVQQVSDFIRQQRLKGFTGLVVSARMRQLFLHWYGPLRGSPQLIREADPRPHSVAMRIREIMLCIRMVEERITLATQEQDSLNQMESWKTRKLARSWQCSSSPGGAQ